MEIIVLTVCFVKVIQHGVQAWWAEDSMVEIKHVEWMIVYLLGALAAILTYRGL